MAISILFPALPLTQILNVVTDAFAIPAVQEPKTQRRNLPPVFPSLFERNTIQDQQISFLDEREQAALAYIQSLSFLKLLDYIEAEIVFPQWYPGNAKKNSRRGIQKLVKLLTVKGLSKHQLATESFLSADYLGQKNEWARSALSLMLDFGLIRLYRHRIFQDGLKFPLAVNAVKAFYARRLEQLDLSEKSWCDEGFALDHEGRQAAYEDFRRMLAKLERGLCAQAKSDAELLITFTGKQTGLVKRLAIENYLFQSYRECFIVSGITAPRFSWQLKSNLSKSAAEGLVAEFG